MRNNDSRYWTVKRFMTNDENDQLILLSPGSQVENGGARRKDTTGEHIHLIYLL
jgi:hypothetical protein